MSVYDLDPQEYNSKLAEALKKFPEISAPEWIAFVKSGPAKVRPINDADFWFKRTSSVLRQIYKKKTVGVNKLRVKYGSRKRRGSKPKEFRKSGGKILRTILQQTDKAGLTEIAKAIKGVRSKRPGRQLTEKGKKFMEGFA